MTTITFHNEKWTVISSKNAPVIKELVDARACFRWVTDRNSAVCYDKKNKTVYVACPITTVEKHPDELIHHLQRMIP